MTLAVCLDEQNGRLFNHRRQSRDRVVLQDAAALCRGRLLVLPFSAALFEQAAIPVTVTEMPEEIAGPEDLCFFEEGDLSRVLAAAQRLVIYRWNRRYPADTVWPGPVPPHGWIRQTIEELQGFSHETIAKEVYVRCHNQ